MIAGLKGGSGKTTLSLGLLRLWSNVIPYKKGPDYIDAGWLSLAAGNSCYNLDTYLMNDQDVITSFISHSEGFDVSLIEGNRGIFDGMDRDGTYSTASLAKLLNCPVILVVDCIKTTSTIGVIVKGINDFDKDLNIAGVVLNQIATKRQETVIRDAVEYHSGVKVLGVLKKGRDVLLPERHMGLLSSVEHIDPQHGIDAIANIVKETVDVSAIRDIAQNAPQIISNKLKTKVNTIDKQLRIGALRDKAFQFYYPDNLDALRDRGAEIIEIDAINDIEMPDIDALYIGGGFPETNAIDIASNYKFIDSLRSSIESGLPVYAECGGLMFLGRSIIFNSNTYKMTGIFPLDFEVSHSPKAHGYTEVEVIDADNPFYPRGAILKGHEFHYSYVINSDTDNIRFAFKMKRGKGIMNGVDGAIYKNVLATYTHVHVLGTPLWADGFIRAGLNHKIIHLKKG
jgi:cobyrinic acid a,c-diamide synthase